MANQWHFNKYQPNGTVNLDEHQTELKPVNGVIGNAIDAVSSIADTVKDKPFIVDTTGGDNKMLVADRLKAIADAVKANKKPLSVRVVYQVKGKSGVPTFMDWAGCVGSVKVLLQK